MAAEKDGARSHLSGSDSRPLRTKKASVLIAGRDWDVGGVRKEVSRFPCGKPGLAPIILAWYVCPASFCPFPAPVGCLAMASLRYRCTVTAGDAEEVGRATQELLPGAWAA